MGESTSTICDGADWNGSLSTAASAGNMPDLFMLAQVPTGLSNDWLLPLNEVTEEQKEEANQVDSSISGYDELMELARDTWE